MLIKAQFFKAELIVSVINEVYCNPRTTLNGGEKWEREFVKTGRIVYY